METNIVHKDGHYEAYINGVFVCSADTMTEAIREVKEYLKKENE